MSDYDVSEIERLARALNQPLEYPSPWFVRHSTDTELERVGSAACVENEDGQGLVVDWTDPVLCEYIVSVQPTAILALCAENERLRADAERLEGSVLHQQRRAEKSEDAGEWLRVRLERMARVARRRGVERDALQQRVDNVQAVTDELWDDAERQRNRRDEPLGVAYLHRATALTGAVKRLRAALGGPAAPPQEPQPTSGAMCGAYVGQGWDQEDDCHCILRPEHAGECRCAHTARRSEPEAEWVPRYRHAPLTDRQSEPVERITDANGDETERGADTDTENTHQQNGDHR